MDEMACSRVWQPRTDASCPLSSSGGRATSRRLLLVRRRKRGLSKIHVCRVVLWLESLSIGSNVLPSHEVTLEYCPNWSPETKGGIA